MRLAYPLALASVRRKSAQVGGLRGGLLEPRKSRGPQMALTDSALKALKSRAKASKAADEKGLYVHVTPAGG